MIVVNLKAYTQAIGKNAEEVARKCEKAAENTGEKVVICPQTIDILRLRDVEIPIFAQHVDEYESGSHTGSNLASALKQAEVSGTLLNHSERRLETEKLRKSVEKAKEKKLDVILCAQSPEEVEKLSKLEPDFVAFEPPELIGGNTSVSTAEPDMIKQAVERSEVPVLTGAGIKTQKDVEKSIELGCKGVLVASGVVKADNIQEEVEDLCEGL